MRPDLQMSTDPEPGPDLISAKPQRSMVVPFALASLLTYAFLVVVPLIGGIPPIVALFGGSLLFAVVTVVLVAVGSAWRTPPLEEGLLAAAMLVGWALALKLSGISDGLRLYVGPLASVLFLLGCIFVGKILSRIVRERAIVLPVCIVAGLADVFTVFWGPTGQALEKAPKLVEKLSVAVPAAGSAVGPEGIRGIAHVATMGLGDFIFLALFLSLAIRFEFALRKTLWATLIGCCLGIVFALSNPFGIPGTPLLPYMSAGFIVANFRDFHLSPQERRDLIIALGVLVLMFIAVAAALRL